MYWLLHSCYECMAVLNEKKYLLLRWISEIFVINVLGLISMDVNTRQIVIAMSKKYCKSLTYT